MEKREKEPSSLEKKEVKIINLSSRSLDLHEISLLEHGLKFCPNPKKPDGKVELVNNLKEFENTLKIRDFFHGKNSSDKSLLKNRSEHTFNHKNEAISQFIKSIVH